MASNSPIAATRLRQICNDACDAALSSSSAYEHGATQTWNHTIINSILKALISESSNPTPAAVASADAGDPPPQAQPPRYKFAVNSTIIQHLSDPLPAENGTQTDDDGEAAARVKGGLVDGGSGKHSGRRGMHSASGAYWNNERDGMWSHKYDGGEGKGMDIVISIMWIGV